MQSGFCTLKGSRMIKGARYIVICDRGDLNDYDNGLWMEYRITPEMSAYYWHELIEPEHRQNGIGQSWFQSVANVIDDEPCVCALYHNLHLLGDGIYFVRSTNPTVLFSPEYDEKSLSLKTYLAVVNGSVVKRFSNKIDVIRWLQTHYHYIHLIATPQRYQNLSREEATGLIVKMLAKAIPSCFLLFESIRQNRNKLLFSDSYRNAKDFVRLLQENASIVQNEVLQCLQVGRDPDPEDFTYDVTVLMDQLGILHHLEISISIESLRELEAFQSNGNERSQ